MVVFETVGQRNIHYAVDVTVAADPADEFLYTPIEGSPFSFFTSQGFLPADCYTVSGPLVELGASAGEEALFA